MFVIEFDIRRTALLLSKSVEALDQACEQSGGTWLVKEVSTIDCNPVLDEFILYFVFNVAIVCFLRTQLAEQLSAL